MYESDEEREDGCAGILLGLALAIAIWGVVIGVFLWLTI